jgi:hypothetical protein
MKKHIITIEDAINLWLKYHNTTLSEVVEKHQWYDNTHTRAFYSTYAVTQEQHDEWYEEIIKLVSKWKRISIKSAKKAFVYDYINCAPDIRKDV